MKKILFVIFALTLASNVLANEVSECDGISTWSSISKNSPDVMVRTCNLFGMDFFEIKSQLNENRCIVIQDITTGSEWKNFFLRNQSIKALANPYVDPAYFKVASTDARASGCKS
jgi:hypothetical protein